MPAQIVQDSSIQNPQPQGVTQSIQPQKTKKKKININRLFLSTYFRIALTFLMMIILFLTASFIAFRSEQKRRALEEYEVQIPDAEIIIPETKENSTENWETYVNQRYVYTLKYPPDLVIDRYDQAEGEEEIVGFINEAENKTFIINVSELQQDKNLYTAYKFEYEESLNEEQSPENISGTTLTGANIEGGYKKVSISDIEAYQLELITDKNFTSTSLLNKDGVIYQFTFLSTTETDKKTLDQILSTFEFTR